MISIVIPTYNEENYLPTLLCSIQEQDFKDYEIIVADNNSKDRTRELARAAGARVVSGGKLPAIGRNNGARRANGDILLFLDADGYMPRGFLLKALCDFKKRKLGVAGCYMAPMSDKLVDKAYFNFFNKYIFSTQKIFPTLGGGCMLARKDVHEKAEGFDEQVLVLEEYDYVKKCLKYGDFGVIRHKFYTSVRRFENFGRLTVGGTLVLLNIYRALFGPIKKEIFKYEFDYKK